MVDTHVFRSFSFLTLFWAIIDRADINYDMMWRGVFMWDMRYAWNLVPEKYSAWKLTEVDPFPNPVLVGCSLAIGRKFFDDIGKTFVTV